MRFPSWLVGLLPALLVVALWWALAGEEGADTPRPAPAGVETRPWDGIEPCEDGTLPATMVPVIEDIWTGGPYKQPDRDGTRFANYEGHLPDEDLGHYREFTVPTPGLNHRGPRRIVTGGATEEQPEVWYYTEDHYESFCEFAP